MKPKSETIKLWTCPKCGRQFERHGQSHSCRFFPLEQHFEGKPGGRLLYEKFKQGVKKQTGPFKIESLPCCIHFVSTVTFTAVKIFKDKIRVDFSLRHPIKSKRVSAPFQMSAHRYLYATDILQEDGINEELMEWILEAYDRNTEKVKPA